MSPTSLPPDRTGSAAPHTFPSPAQLDALARSDEQGPLVMLNLNRYRDRASYPDGRDAAGLAGRDAYLRYGLVARDAIEAVGGRILWSADAVGVLVGCDHDAFDEVVAVWYPDREAFFGLTEVPGYEDALIHRDAALDHAAIIICSASDRPELGTPFDG